MAKWITKANDDVLSFCTCEHSLASLPGQLDCPWCGCGYLLSCTFCRKAFTYGRIVHVDHSVAELVRADRVRGGYEIDEGEIANEAEMIADMLEPFAIGDVVVYLDGVYFRSGERNLTFDGIHSHHDLIVLPHEVARVGLAPFAETIGTTDYWMDREQGTDSAGQK